MMISSVSVFLLVVAGIFLVGILGELLFDKTGIPDVVWLILVGIALGPISGILPRAGLQQAAPYFGALTLVIVLFDGGSELRISELSKAAGRGSVLAVLGFVLAVLVVTPVAYVASWLGILPESWGWVQCILLGTILSGSSSVVIMPALRMAGLSPKISNLVNLESALTDVLAVVATGACIAVAKHGGDGHGGPGSEAADAGLMFGQSFGVGIGGGVLLGFVLVLVLRRLGKSVYAYPLILGSLLVLYVLIDENGGSAALGILAASVMIGNAPTLSKKIGLAKTARLSSNVEGIHDEITFIVKSFFFTFIGAMLGPDVRLTCFGVFIGILLLLARIPNVIISTTKSDLSVPARKLVTVLMPRGMAAGVLAMMPYQAGIRGTKDLPVVVFAAVFTTILLFAIGFPVLKKTLPASDLADTPERGTESTDAKSTDADADDTVVDGRSPYHDK